MPEQSDGVGVKSRQVYRGRIERVLERARDLRSLFVSTQGTKLPRFSPGMFISIAMPLGDEVRSRPYSIASTCDEEEPFELLFNLVPGGRGSRWLFERRVGDEFDFSGPFGLFVLDQAPQTEVIFVAEGAGIAPIRPMIRKLLPHPRAVHLLYGAGAPEHLSYQAEFELLESQHRNFKFERFVNADEKALFERLSDRIEQQWIRRDDDRTRRFFICGIGEGVTRLRDRLREVGYERRAVRYERW